MKIAFPILVAAAALVLTACAKDDTYRTSHPDLGAVEVATDWSGKSNESVAPPVYTLRIGDREHVVGGTTNVFGTLLAPGDYDLTAFSTPTEIGLSGNTASVDEAETEGYIAPFPGYLFAGYSRISVAADDTLHVTLPMIQYVRQLDIVLTATEGDYSRVVSATATLSGVARAVNVTTGTLVGDTALVTQPFTRTDNTFATSFRLLRAADLGAPTLTVDFVFDNGDTQSVSTEVPVQPVDPDDPDRPDIGSVSPSIQILIGDLQLPVKGEVTEVTITDWQLGNGTGEDVDVK